MAGLVAVACSERFSQEEPQQTAEGFAQEEAFPGKKKEMVTLSSGLVLEYYEGCYILGGDVLLTSGQVEKLSQIPAKSAVISERVFNSWPDNTVYYAFAEGFTKEREVMEAIAHWEALTDMVFLPRGSRPNYVEFINGQGNYSYMGYSGLGRQRISLLEGSGSTVGTAIHEIGHTVGLFHEQCRRDRDDSITIHWDNIRSSRQHNYDMFGPLAGLNVGAFDFQSVMLYSSFNSFAVDYALPTMTKKNGEAFVGQRTGLSPGDIEGVREITNDRFTSTELNASLDLLKSLDVTPDFRNWPIALFEQGRVLLQMADFLPGKQSGSSMTGPLMTVFDYDDRINARVYVMYYDPDYFTSAGPTVAAKMCLLHEMFHLYMGCGDVKHLYEEILAGPGNEYRKWIEGVFPDQSSDFHDKIIYTGLVGSEVFTALAPKRQQEIIAFMEKYRIPLYER